MTDIDDVSSLANDEMPMNGDTGSGETPAAPPGRWRLAWGVASAVVVVMVLIGAILVTTRSGDGDETATPVSTASVRRTDIVATETLSGTLGYGTADPIVFATSEDGVSTVDGGASGTVTAIAEEGSTVDFGGVLYEVDSRPIVLLEGSIPMYRAFDSRMSDGPDVAQLEAALVSLGFDPDGDVTIDEDFTSATANAIELLQASVGTDETGRLALGDVIFASAPVFVAETRLAVGDAAHAGDAVFATSRAISGTVTSIIDEGSIVGQGDVLLTIDGEPVVVIVGDIPLYRSLSRGTTGDDVAQLEQALVDLGYIDPSSSPVDGVFSDGTFDAVTTWQAAIGAVPDGVVNIGDVVVAASPIRIGEALVDVGDVVRDGTPIVNGSAGSTFVTVQLSTDDQDLVKVGTPVTVELPNGDRQPAHVTEIGTVVLATQQGGTYFEMTVELDDTQAAQGLDEAPVDVDVDGDRADGVLAVPVTSLLALAEGGYAVEVVAADGSTTLVAVTPGLFADGFVEVDSQALTEGMDVVVP